MFTYNNVNKKFFLSFFIWKLIYIKFFFWTDFDITLPPIYIHIYVYFGYFTLMFVDFDFIFFLFYLGWPVFQGWNFGPYFLFFCLCHLISWKVIQMRRFCTFVLILKSVVITCSHIIWQFKLWQLFYYFFQSYRITLKQSIHQTTFKITAHPFYLQMYVGRYWKCFGLTQFIK